MQHADGTEEDQRGMSEMSQMRGENDEKKNNKGCVERGKPHSERVQSKREKEHSSRQFQLCVSLSTLTAFGGWRVGGGRAEEMFSSLGVSPLVHSPAPSETQ